MHDQPADGEKTRLFDATITTGVGQSIEIDVSLTYELNTLFGPSTEGSIGVASSMSSDAILDWNHPRRDANANWAIRRDIRIDFIQLE